MFKKILFTLLILASTIISQAQIGCVGVIFASSVSGSTATFVSTLPPNYSPNNFSWTFGDGGTSNINNPSHTYANNGQYYVCMTVSGFMTGTNTPFQCLYCDSVVITAGAQPCNSDFSFTTSGLTSNFTSLATGPGTITNYAWNFGDGNQSNLQNPMHTYANAGWYNACLTIYGIYNNVTYTCTYCDSVYVSGGAQPCVSNFSFTTSGLTSNFTSLATGPGTITNYAWNFGDGNQSNLQNPTHTYANNGTYYACLTIYGIYNNVTYTCTYCDSVTVTNGAQPCFTSYSYTVGAGNVYSFTSTSTAPGPISTYQWTFGDGGTANTQNPIHTYATTGMFNVCLTVSGIITGTNLPFSCNYCDSIQVGNVPQPCNSDFSFTTSGLTSNFTSLATGPGTITNYAWNFGDGNQSNLQNPTHTYANAGWYNVCLTIYGIYNNVTYTCTYCDSVYVSGGAQPCTASYTYTVGAGNVYSFTSTSTAPGPISTYQWDFGDGGTANTQNPVHTYATAGWYNVCLIISGQTVAGFFQCYYCDSVYVQGGPQPCNSNFSFTTSGLTSNFTSLATGPGSITNYAWNFGDGNQSNLQNPTHTYANAGWYNACLTIYGIYNNVTYTCTYCDSVYVSGGAQPCVASYSYNIGANNVVSFTSTSTAPGPISTYQWNFGDGGTANTQNPVHTYATAGWYNVCLIISGQTVAGFFQCYTCDSIYVQGGVTPGGCNVIANYTGSISGYTASFTNLSSCIGCTSVSYSWSFGDGGTSTLTNPSHTYAAGGNYNVCLIATGIDSIQQVCIDTFCYTVIIGASSVNNVKESIHSIEVYPNPSQDYIEVKLPQADNFELKIMDVAGKTISTERIEKNTEKIKLDVSNYANGMYYLQLNSTTTKYHSSFIKQ